jgi:membrane-associated phospholipid phosphatase
MHFLFSAPCSAWTFSIGWRPWFRSALLSVGLLAAVPAPLLRAQVLRPAPTRADTLHKYESPLPGTVPSVRPPFLQRKLVRASLVPAVLIGYGASTINGNGLYSSYAAQHDVRHLFGTYRNSVDDYLQFAPYAVLAGLVTAGVETRDDRLNLLLIIAKSEAIMLGSVYAVKTTAGILRPDGSDRLSFPSGHAAQAFLAASIVHTELRDKSQWYGVGAYTLATSVAAFRMINNKHWQSDVVAGAGFGILSAHLAYLSHRHRWGRRPTGRGVGDVSLTPAYSPAGGAGLSLSWRPK